MIRNSNLGIDNSYAIFRPSKTLQPPFDWWVCILSVKIPGEHYLLAVLPCNSIVHVEFASLDSICKEVDHGVVAWFILICPVASLNVMGACGTLAGGESGDA